MYLYFHSLLFHSILNSIDTVNFNEDKRSEDRNVIEKFLFDLLEKSIEPEVERLIAEETTALQESSRPPKEQPSTSGSFLSIILREQDRNLHTQINPARKREEKLAELKMKIRSEIDKYFLHCRSIDWLKTLEEHPTENYNKEHVLQQVTQNETHLKNPLWLAHRFDVLSWWRKVGTLLFPYMAVGAPIVLAKPAHNGYQERVFSLGKFCDSPLRSNQTAANFEMRVLDTINKNNKCFEKFNSTYIEEKDQFVNNFFQYENVAKILSMEDTEEEVAAATAGIILDNDMDPLEECLRIAYEDDSLSGEEDGKPRAVPRYERLDCESEDDEDIAVLDQLDNSSVVMEDDDDYIPKEDSLENLQNKELVIQL
jgi:hypothetical protein